MTACKRALSALGILLALWIAPLHVMADGLSSQNARRTSANTMAPPRVGIDLITARDADGSALGTLVMPSLLAPVAKSGSVAGLDHVDRPLLVVFNGGPGAGSAWLQLGLLGPQHVVLPAPNEQVAGQQPAGRLEPNRDGLWSLADILFVDPLGTGFSRTGSDVAASRVREWQADGDYLARAIAAWMAKHDRLAAPVILMGESYGTERAIAVGEALERAHPQVRVAGMVLISQTVLSEFGVRQHDAKLATAIALPTMAATACYFGRAGVDQADPVACAQQAWRFAMDNYAAAARTGAMRPALARMTGVPEQEFAGPDLSLSRDRYRQIALADRAMVLGRYDSRLPAPVDPVEGWQDPSLAPLLPVMTALARQSVRETQNLARSPIDHGAYVLFDGAILHGWRYGPQAPPPGSPAMAARLAALLAHNGATLLVAGGLFDAVGSYGADRYLVEWMRLPPGRTQIASYPGGHMFYLDDQNRAAFLARLRGYIGHISSPQGKTAPI
ncbi:S10 family serine carboxypeptidase-like protein [Novosphingobium sp.]|uniref:S10 family serine carboxypeptidase-like protein n=1 Tax=Novosphingobium sp. TaxID=1874826 RepID=UPI0038BA98BC